MDRPADYEPEPQRLTTEFPIEALSRLAQAVANLPYETATVLLELPHAVIEALASKGEQRSGQWAQIRNSIDELEAHGNLR